MIRVVGTLSSDGLQLRGRIGGDQIRVIKVAGKRIKGKGWTVRGSIIRRDQ